MTTAAPSKDVAGYRTLQEVSVRSVNGDSYLHQVGTILSAWEVEDYVKTKIEEGSHRYRQIFEPLTEQEVDDERQKATALEGDRVVDGQHISPPWEDYVGLHPEEIINRLRTSDKDVVERVRLYERGGLNRQDILSYVAPVEREPWVGYDELNVREVLEKLAVLSPEHVHEAIAYESAHRRRPAIITHEPSQTEEVQS